MQLQHLTIRLACTTAPHSLLQCLCIAITVWHCTFSTPDLPCRKGFQHVLASSNQVLARIQEAGPGATLDMDNLLLRQSLDVIGLVGFEQDMGGTRSLDNSSEASNCLVISVTAMQEIERRFRDPFRGRKFWRKVSCPSLVPWRLQSCT